MIRVSDASVMRALDALLDGRTKDQWMTIFDIVEELTKAYNENPIRFSSRGLSSSTYARWHEYVDRNQRRGYTFRDIVRVLYGGGYQRDLREVDKTKLTGIRVPVWGGR